MIKITHNIDDLVSKTIGYEKIVSDLNQQIRILQQIAIDRDTTLALHSSLETSFEEVLKEAVKESQGNEWNIKIGVEPDISETLIDVLSMWQELKVQFLGSQEIEVK